MGNALESIGNKEDQEEDRINDLTEKNREMTQVEEERILRV